MNSVLEILAMVRCAPSCFAITPAVILVVSEDVTAIKSAAVSICASLKIAIDVASPLMVFMSRCSPAYAKLSFLVSIRVISCDS